MAHSILTLLELLLVLRSYSMIQVFQQAEVVMVEVSVLLEETNIAL
jgi:hypothetical protein